MASAKFANSTVNQSQSAIWMPNKSPPAPVTASLITNKVVSAAPTSTTNMTGFLATIRGLSLTKDSFVALRRISGSKSGRARTPFEMSCVPSLLLSGLRCCGGAVRVDISKHLPAEHLEMLNYGAQRKRGEIRQRANDHDRSDKQNYEERAVSRQRAARHGYQFLPCKTARDRECRNDKKKSRNQHVDAECQVVPGRIGTNSRKGASVVTGAAGVCVENFREAVRSAVVKISGSRTVGAIPVSALLK